MQANADGCLVFAAHEEVAEELECWRMLTYADGCWRMLTDAGKCSVLAAPDEEVAEELADVVCQMLLEAIKVLVYGPWATSVCAWQSSLMFCLSNAAWGNACSLRLIY